MPISYSDPIYKDIGGRRHVSYDITETGTGPSDEWQLPIQEFATLTLVHSVLETAGSATEVDPEVGTESGWAVDGIEHVARSSAPGASVRITDREVLVARNGYLYGRSKPDNTAGTITTRVSWVEGHVE